MKVLRGENRISIWGYALALFAFLVPLEGYLSTSAGSILKFYTIGCILFAFYHIFSIKKCGKLHSSTKWLIAFLVITGLSITWSGHMMRGVDVYMAIALQLVFIIVCSLQIYNRKEIEFVMLAYVLACIAVAVIMLLTVSQAEIEQSRHSLSSGSGKTFDPNNIGAMLVSGFALILNFPTKTKQTTVLKVATIVLLAFGVIYTASRGAFTAMLLVALFTVFQQKGKRKFRIIVSVGIITLLVIVISSLLANNPLDFLLYRFMSDDSGSNRTFLWKVALQCIAERPLFGYGLGESAYVIGKWHTTQYGSHNTYLTIMFESGVFAIIILICTVLNLLSKARKDFYLDKCAVSMLISGLVTSFFFDTYNKKILWFPMLICVIAASVKAVNPDGTRLEKTNR